MKTGPHYFVASLLFCLSAACHADDEITLSYPVAPETGIANPEGVESAAFPGHGCIGTRVFLLPALFGDAGMREFVHADGIRTTCAFHTVNPAASGVSLLGTGEAQGAPEITQSRIDSRPEDALPNPSTGANPSPPEASRKTEGAAAPKLVQSLSGVSTPGRADWAFHRSRPVPVNKGAGRANKTVSSAGYRWVLFVSATVLVLALMALLGAFGMLSYRRWFSERAILARAVNRGLRRNEFHLEYQPVFYTSTRKCIGLEVALRWKNVAYGLRGETWYMDKLVDCRSTRKIVAFVLTTAGRELDHLADGRKLYLMINLWKTCLENEECASLIAATVKSFTSCRLVFQVKAEDLPQQLGNIARLREDKVRIAVSGVRAGTSMTASALPVDFEFIKVDRDVMGLDESDRLRTLQAIAAAGRQLDVAVIADGVEGSGQYHAVGRARIALAQGFFLGKAIPAGQLPALFEKLDRWQGKHVSTASAASLA